MKSKRQMSKELGELKSKLAKLEEEINSEKIEKQQDNLIDFPMEFAQIGIGLGLKFGSNQVLFFSGIDKMWKVLSFTTGNKAKYKIQKQPTPYYKLEVGKWYFDNSGSVDDIESYNLYLGNDKFKFIEDASEGDYDIKTHEYNEGYNYHEVIIDEE